MKKIALPRICITATGESPKALLDSTRRALEYCRFVELRLDWLPNPSEALPQVRRLLESSHSAGNSIIFQATCRREPNGGRFKGTVAEQVEILREAAQAGCRILDLEVESTEAVGAEAVEGLRKQAMLILSWHNFHGTPRLETIARRLRRFPADFYKMVPTATRQSDNCTALDFLSSIGGAKLKREQWIVFCMEQAGIPSRVLALSRGSAFVYASCPDNRERAKAAPGQIDYETLRNVYRAEKLTRRTAIYGLLGNPVGHSLGAAIHNAAFQHQRLDAVYLPLLSSDLKDFRKAADRYPLAGFSVTIPHKQRIFHMLDRMDRTVRLAGAANTVRIQRGKWEAINSDVEGILVPLRKTFRLPERKSLGRSFRAVIVGTGGAARAALVALKELRCGDIVMAGRNLAKARALAKEFGGIPLPLDSLEREHFHLMIHATSVGMWPRNDECLLRPEQVNADTVFDLVYNPAETRLLQLARKRGWRTISGIEMFLAQAARQFEYWTGTEAPRALMRKIAERELAKFQPPEIPG